MFFIRGNNERSDGDQSIIGDISIRSSQERMALFSPVQAQNTLAD